LPWSPLGKQLFLAGQIYKNNGRVLYAGKVGRARSRNRQLAAQTCALNLLAILNQAVKRDLGRVVSCVRVNGFVNVAPGFHDVLTVINGASDLFFDLFGEAGRYARSAIDVATLPANAAV
jgi:enamine deaminase RidA (YjgF/YER057c/UK114 family)